MVWVGAKVVKWGSKQLENIRLSTSRSSGLVDSDTLLAWATPPPFFTTPTLALMVAGGQIG